MGQGKQAQVNETETEVKVTDIHVQEIRRNFLSRFNQPVLSILSIVFFIAELVLCIISIKTASDTAGNISVTIAGLALLSWLLSIVGILLASRDLRSRLERSRISVIGVVLNTIVLVLLSALYIWGMLI